MIWKVMCWTYRKVVTLASRSTKGWSRSIQLLIRAWELKASRISSTATPDASSQREAEEADMADEDMGDMGDFDDMDMMGDEF